MTAKQEFLALLDMMSEEDITYALSLVKDNFALHHSDASWEKIKEIDPVKEDFLLIDKIQNKKDGYGEYITQDELLKKLGIEV